MRIVYIPHSQKVWENHFKAQVHQSGHGFEGRRYQRGTGIGSILGGLFRTILPAAAKVGKAVGREALRTGASVASDALQGRDIRDSFEHHGRAAGSKLIRKGMKKLDRPKKSKKKRKQKGGSFGFMPVTKRQGDIHLAFRKKKPKKKRDRLDL